MRPGSVRCASCCRLRRNFWAAHWRSCRSPGCLRNPHVSTVITGASRPARVVENMQARRRCWHASSDVNHALYGRSMHGSGCLRMKKPGYSLLNNAGKLRNSSLLTVAARLQDVVPQEFAGRHRGRRALHDTFVENALAKAPARGVVEQLACAGRLSGICLAALNGAPGVHSARCRGQAKSDARNNALMLEKLAGVEDRRAHYVCVLVFVRSASDPQPLITEGEWR